MKKRILSGAMAVFAFSFAFSMVSLMAFASDKAEVKPYKVGDEVSAFTLKDTAGKTHDLGELLGKKIIVLEFWNLGCPVSRGYINRMKALHDKYGKEKDSEMVFFAIDSNEPNDEKSIQAFAQEQGMKYPVLKDWKSKIADRFGAERTPEIFVIDKNRVIQYHGAIDDSQDESKIKNRHLDNALAALKEGKEPPKKETVSFGCGIKRGSDS